MHSDENHSATNEGRDTQSLYVETNDGESMLGFSGCSALLASVFPVFEWDDNLVSDQDSQEESPPLREQELARLLPPAQVSDRGEPEVRSVLEDALGSGILPLGSDAPRRPPSHMPASPPQSPQASVAAVVAAVSLAPTPQRHGPGSFTPSQSCASTVLTTGGLTLGGSVTSSLAFQGDGHPILSPASPHGPQRFAMEPAGQLSSFDDISHASSVYALNGTGDSNAIFGDSLLLDFNQLIALGRAPTRQRLTDAEAQSLPRVRFDAPDLQHCSICLEEFKHGMLLTSLHCGHVFHVDCVTEWAQRAAECPNCRMPMLPHGGAYALWQLSES